MRFCVCVKQVPDVGAAVETGRMVLNAYDASAVEECLVLRDEHGGTVDLVCVGPERVKETLRKALAMGADAAFHLEVDDTDFDPQTLALVLADFFRANAYDLIACGKQAQDTDAGVTGAMLAELLELPYATNAVGLEVEGEAVVVTRQGDSGQEVIELQAPCLVTCSNDMNDPRIPSLKGIMAAKKKTIESTAVSVASDRTRLAVLGHEQVPERAVGRLIEEDAEAAVDELVRALAEEARVI